MASVTTGGNRLTPFPTGTNSDCLEDNYNCNAQEYIKDAKNENDVLKKDMDFLEKVLTMYLSSNKDVDDEKEEEKDQKQ